MSLYQSRGRRQASRHVRAHVYTLGGQDYTYTWARGSRPLAEQLGWLPWVVNPSGARRTEGEKNIRGRHGMPTKRKSSDERGGDGAAKRPALQYDRQHLYLLLDDWERGYSVRRLDVDAFESDDAGADDLPKRFTGAAEHASDRTFVSHGTKIFAMQPGEASPAIPAFDARTLGLSVCPRPFSDRDYGLPFFASAAGKLLVFTDTHAVYLGDQPPYGSKAPWSWTAIEARSPFYASQMYKRPHDSGGSLQPLAIWL
ncbi:hypothetical protein C2845_PM12G29690 [Panicum miliaceum]|uniref:Uncharacterized protein n=1 Tax=Panicum miliaceum TaxID=4540 RepID=A0A3L6QJG1_PANMI|nr:hypothetical protein C2845_PM12G29690 [Panicum miliaceum]